MFNILYLVISDGKLNTVPIKPSWVEIEMSFILWFYTGFLPVTCGYIKKIIDANHLIEDNKYYVVYLCQEQF